MSKDLSRLLAEWPYDEHSNVRRFTGEDGREKLQIRVCVDTFHGLLQLECDGRPDGKRPRGQEFYLDHVEKQRQSFIETGGAQEQYRLTRLQCRRLFEEGNQVYRRYVLLLQIGDFARVVRDTARNMRLFRFVHAHAQHPADREHLECWWPYILRIHYTAVAMERLSAGRLEETLQAVEECRRRLSELAPQENEAFSVELKRSQEALNHMEAELRKRRPLSELEKLEKLKAAAIQGQRYEEAARLRDRIARLKVSPPAGGEG